MKLLVILSMLVAFTAAAVLTPGELQILEAFDFEALFANDKQRNIVFDCLLEKGDCGAYKQLTELSKKAMISQCADCSPAQKKKYKTVLKQFHDQYGPVYREFMKKIIAAKNHLH